MGGEPVEDDADGIIGVAFVNEPVSVTVDGVVGQMDTFGSSAAGHERVDDVGTVRAEG